jgi:peptidyl-prolyl cis-trans isomerase A (cyclophilin A)
MRLMSRLLAGVLMLACVASAQDAGPAAPAPERAPPTVPPTVAVVLHTALGDIQVALEVQRAPVTAANFLKYVDQKKFDGITLYRAVKIGEEGRYGLVQGGLRGDRKKALPPIVHEAPSATGISHLDGTISMARESPGSATGDFFFVVGDLVSLDGVPSKDDPGYAAFGRVTSGMDIVRSVLDLPRAENPVEPGMQGQILAAPVKILSVRRVE